MKFLGYRKDIADFAEKLLALYHNPEIREDMRRNNAEDAKKYAVDIAVERMAGIYRDCVGGK